MNQKTEKDIVLYYLNNLLKRPMYGEFEDHICDWFEKNSRELIGKDIEDFWESKSRFRRRRSEEDEPSLPRDSKTIQTLLGGRTGRWVNTPEVVAVIDAFHISPEYHDVLALRIHVTNIHLLGKLVEAHRGIPEPRVMAGMLDMP